MCIIHILWSLPQLCLTIDAEIVSKILEFYSTRLRTHLIPTHHYKSLESHTKNRADIYMSWLDNSDTSKTSNMLGNLAKDMSNNTDPITSNYLYFRYTSQNYQLQNPFSLLVEQKTKWMEMVLCNKK